MPSEFGPYDGLATLGGGDPNNDGRYIEASRPVLAVRRQGLAKASSIF